MILLIGGGLKTIKQHKAVFMEMQKKKNSINFPEIKWAKNIKTSFLSPHTPFIQRIYFKLNFSPFHLLLMDAGYIAAGGDENNLLKAGSV